MSKHRAEAEWTACAQEMGTRIQALRAQKGLSQEHVAFVAGISRYTFQKLEKGESAPGIPANPSIRNLIAVAQVLGTTIDQLVPAQVPDLRRGVSR